MSVTSTPLASSTVTTSRPRRVLHWVRRNPLLAAVLAFITLLTVCAIVAPLLAPYPSDAGAATHPFSVLHAPSRLHLFGTDQVGRDILSRIIYGTRISPLIAVAVLAIATLVGVPLGLVAGYFGGVLDDIIMRVTDIFLAVPALLLALALSSVLSPTIGSTIVAIAVTWWPWYARLVRGEAASIRGRRYIESCQALGIPRWRILWRHVLPNATTPVVVQMSLDFGTVILTASALSFLGLGVQDPSPDWGLMVSEGQAYFLTDWWLVTFPGLAILLTALAFNVLGDGLRDRLDPRHGMLK